MSGGPVTPSGDDILIGSATRLDANDAALAAVLAEWTSDRDYATRVADLSGVGSGPRLNGGTFLTATGARATVLDDGDRDVRAERGSTGSSPTWAATMRTTFARSRAAKSWQTWARQGFHKFAGLWRGHELTKAQGWPPLGLAGSTARLVKPCPNAAAAATKEDKAQEAFCCQNGVAEAPFWSRTPCKQQTLSPSSSLPPLSPFLVAMID